MTREEAAAKLMYCYWEDCLENLAMSFLDIDKNVTGALLGALEASEARKDEIVQIVLGFLEDMPDLTTTVTIN